MYQNVVSRLARNAVVAAVILFAPQLLSAASATLAWDRAASHTNLSAFVLKYGVSSGSYTGKVSVATNFTSATVNDLVPGVRYFFAVTARNVAGLESDPSNEISHTPPTTAPNVLPTLNPLNNLTISEDAAQQSVTLAGITAGIGDLLQILTVTATSSNPSLIPTPSVIYTSPNTTGTLRFTPVANATGTATITVRVNDGGLLNNLLSRTFTVTVNPVNDAPTLSTLANQSLNINAGQRSVSLAGISSGAANESQVLTVTASSSNPGLIPTPAVTYTSPGTTGTLRFTPVANATGTATISVTVNDGQAQNNTVTRSFAVAIAGVANQPPTLSAISNVTINEDAAQQTINLAGIGSGSTSENQALVVTATSSNPSLIPTPTVLYTSPNTTGSLRFAPVGNATGVATIMVTVNDGQAQNNTFTRSFSVTVNAVNDAPTLGAISSRSLAVNAPRQTISLTGIGSGAVNETQVLVVSATSSNPGLIPAPTVAYSSPSTSGTLSFTPVANVIGAATITVTVNDGQAQNNLVTRSIAVTVTNVATANQPPTLSALSNVIINEDATQYTVNLSGIGSGSMSEIQALTATATSSNPSLIPTPTIIYTSPNTTGTLRFTPIGNASGTATITVTVNDGQAQSNTVARSFLVTINAVNDAPTLNGLSNLSLSANASQQTVSLGGISSGAANESQAMTVTATSSNPGLIPNPTVTYTSPGTTGSLRFAPVANASGTATITVTVNDGQAQNNLVTRSFTVSVAGSIAQTIYVQAETGARVSPMSVGSDTSAANGQYIYSTVANQGTASFSFTTTRTTNYSVWCRVLAPDNGRDSFFFKVDNGIEEIFTTAPSGNWSSSWQWVKLNVIGVVKALPLTQGNHTLVIRCREAYSYLDALYITSDPNFTPPTGGGATLAAAGAPAQLVEDEIPDGTVDSAAPVISGLEVTESDARSITLSWQTDEPVRSRVDYGIDALLSEGALVNSNFTTEHVLTLPGLQPDTAYLIQIHAVDPAGNSAMTEIGMASTAPMTCVAWSAEAGTSTSPLRTWSSRDAIGKLCVAGTAGGGSIEFPVQIDVPSNYFLWCRLRSPVQDDWAFKLTIDGVEPERPMVNGLRTGFKWRWVSLMRRPLSLGSGPHEVRLDSIPAGVALDELLLTNDPEWRPSEALD